MTAVIIFAKRKQPDPPSSDYDAEDGSSDGDMQADAPSPRVSQQHRQHPTSLSVWGILKRPATATPSKAGSASGLLAFPGTTPKAPLAYGDSKVYFAKHKYKLLEQVGGQS